MASPFTSMYSAGAKQLKTTGTSSSLPTVESPANNNNNNNNNNTTTPTSIFQGVETKERDVFAPSMNTKILAKRDEKLTPGQIKEIEAMGVRVALLNSAMGTPRRVGKDAMLLRRYTKLESILTRLRDPTGVSFTDKKRMFDVQPASAPGADIIDWIMTSLKCMHRTEARQIFRRMVEHSYLIPLNGGVEVPTDDETPDSSDILYTFQADFLFPSRWWEGSELDYAIFLLRRSSKTGGQNMLTRVEIERFTQVQKSFDTRWKAVVQGAEKQRIYMHGCERRDKRLYEFRECAFWRHQKPESKLPIHQLHAEDESLGKRRHNFDAWVATLVDHPEQQLAQIERHTAYLQSQLNMVRTAVSTSSLSLIRFCDMFGPLDGLLAQSDTTSSVATNVWLKDETAPWPVDSVEQKPRPEQVAMWCLSFRDMLADPAGIRMFTKFLEKDISTENLMFYLAVTELDSIASRHDWHLAALAIGEQYIRPNAPAEINIVSHMRNAILEELANSTAETLSVYVFTTAVQHIFQLMKKDSYHRFINTDEMKELQNGFQVVRRRFTAIAAVTNSSTDLSAGSGKTISRASTHGSIATERRRRRDTIGTLDRYVPRAQTIASTAAKDSDVNSTASYESSIAAQQSAAGDSNSLVAQD